MAISKFSDIDEYGFEREDGFDPQQYEKYMEEYVGILAKRSRKWTILMEKQGNTPLKLNRKLKRYIRKGIPSEFRARILSELSGANALKEKEKNDFFVSLLSKPTIEDVIEAITLDLSRTFPNNIYFRSPGHHQSQLYNVLLAFANYNTSIGYCQGLNYIAGMLLLISSDDQVSFWLLKALVDDILPDYFLPPMMGVLVDIDVFAELVKMKMPDIHYHLQLNEFPWSLIATKWFVCCYAEVLPTETVLRIWDCLFCEGSKILFRVGLALIVEIRASLLKCDSLAEIMTCFKEIQISMFVINCHSFMQNVFKYSGSLSKSLIQKLRNEKRIFRENERKIRKNKKKNGR